MGSWQQMHISATLSQATLNSWSPAGTEFWPIQLAIIHYRYCVFGAFGNVGMASGLRSSTQPIKRRALTIVSSSLLEDPSFQ